MDYAISHSLYLKCSLYIFPLIILKSNPGLCSKLKCKTIFLCNAPHTLCHCVCSAKGKWVRLPDFCKNCKVFRSSWRKWLKFNVIGERHILNLPVIFPLVGTLAPFSKHTQSFLSQFGIKIISLNAFNFRIILSFDWHKVYHSWRENINTYLNNRLNNTSFVITYLEVKVSGFKYKGNHSI